MSIDLRGQQPTVLRGSAVPWTTVVSLAAVMCYADGFWMISERGAVGAIERTEGAFSHWWRESTLALPLFVLAVLAASMLARRLFGAVLHTPVSVLVSGLLIAVAGTVVGIAVIVANTWYDYSLETDLLRMMDVMRSGCTGPCVALQQQATLAALSRAVLYTGVLVFITNVVLVAWVVAMSGGRLALAAAPRRIRGGAGADHSSMATGRPGLDGARLVLVSATIGSAVIHAAVVPQHLQEWAAAGLFFIALTVTQLLLALVLVMSSARAPLWWAGALNAGLLLLWMYSRTLGLPIGPEAGLPENIGIADAVAGLLEISAAIAALVVLRRKTAVRRPAPTAHHRAFVVVAVLAATIIGLVGALPGLVGGTDAAPGHSTADESLR